MDPAARGLPDNQHNIDIIINEIKAKYQGRFTHAALDKIAFENPNLQFEPGFSPREKSAVWQEWWKNAPKDLLRVNENGTLLIQYLDQFCAGVWSVPNSAWLSRRRRAR